MASASIKQMGYIKGLCTERGLAAPSRELSYEEADSLIKELNKNGSKSQSNIKDEKFAIGFQAALKAACHLYQSRPDKSFKDVFEEVKSLY